MALSRITLQGEANLVKNRGTMGAVFNMDENVSTGYLSARPCSRVTEVSEPNRVRSRGTMEKYLNAEKNISQGFHDAPCPRVTNLSEPNYMKGQGTIKIWLNVEENISSGYESARPAPRACPTELSKAMKEKSKGSMADYVGEGSDYRPLPIERKIHPRGVPPTAASNSIPHKGKRMEMIMHEADKMPESPKPCGRVIKPEAEHIANKHLGKPMANLLTNYGNLPPSTRAPRVTVWGETNMELNQGGRIKNLINEQQRPISARPITSEAQPSSWNLTGSNIYGNKQDNYNRRNATQWSQAWS